MKTYRIPWASRAAASGSRENSGLNREYGAERTSTRYSVPASSSTATSSSTERAP